MSRGLGDVYKRQTPECAQFWVGSGWRKPLQIALLPPGSFWKWTHTVRKLKSDPKLCILSFTPWPQHWHSTSLSCYPGVPNLWARLEPGLTEAGELECNVLETSPPHPTSHPPPVCAEIVFRKLVSGAKKVRDCCCYPIPAARWAPTASNFPRSCFTLPPKSYSWIADIIKSHLLKSFQQHTFVCRIRF